MKNKFWIQDALSKSKKGSLHKELGVPLGQKIPSEKLNAAANAGGLLGKRANLAKTLSGFKHGGKKSSKISSMDGLRAAAKSKGAY